MSGYCAGTAGIGKRGKIEMELGSKTGGAGEICLALLIDCSSSSGSLLCFFAIMPDLSFGEAGGESMTSLMLPVLLYFLAFLSSSNFAGGLQVFFVFVWCLGNEKDSLALE